MKRIDHLLKMNVIALVVTIVFILLVIGAMTLLAQSNDLGIGMFIGMIAGWLIIPLGIMVMLVVVGYSLLICANVVSFGKKFESHGRTILLTRITFFLTFGVLILPCLLFTFLTSTSPGMSREGKALIQDVCNRMWTDENYRKEMEHGGYKKIGSYDHVLIWVDDANGAIFFDTADSLSAGGIVCFKEGAHPPADEGIVAGRRVGRIEDNLYWWY